MSTQSRTSVDLRGGPNRSVRGRSAPWTHLCLPAQAFHVEKAVVPVVAHMAPAYAAGWGGSENLMGPFATTDENTEEVEVRTLVHLPHRFVPLDLNQQLTPRAAWTVLAGAISSEGGGVKAQCAPLLLFLRAVAVEGSSIPFATADLEVVAPDKALEAQRMEILQRDIPARFDTGASGGLSPGDAMTLALTAFEVRTDMLERTRRQASRSSHVEARGEIPS